MDEFQKELFNVLNRIANSLQTPSTAPVTPILPGQPKLSLEEVRAILPEKSRAGFTAQIQQLLEKYGACKLSKIDPAHYQALLKDAEELK